MYVPDGCWTVEVLLLLMDDSVDILGSINEDGGGMGNMAGMPCT